MRRKKKCNKCGKEIEKKFTYCPYCGNRVKEPNGLLDEIDEMQDFGIGLGFGFDGIFKTFNKIINNLTKQIEEEMRRVDKEIKPIMPEEINKKPKVAKGISIKINFSGHQPSIKISEIGKEEKRPKNVKAAKKLVKGLEKSALEKEKLEKFPREEAKAKVRRLSDKIIYEIELPGVKNLDDVEIHQLENSTEIKAVGKDKIYFKLIPIALPIIDYELKKGKLYIYFKPEI